MLQIERRTAAPAGAVLRAIGDTERHREPADPIHPGPRRQVLATRSGERFTLRLMPRIPLTQEYAPTLQGTVEPDPSGGAIVLVSCGYNASVVSGVGGHRGLLSGSAVLVLRGARWPFRMRGWGFWRPPPA